MKQKWTIKGLYLILSNVVMIVIVYPIVWIFSYSLKSDYAIQNGKTYALPTELYLGNYVRAWEGSPLPRYYLNSIIVVVISVSFIVLLSVTAAFALEKFRFKRNRFLLAFFLFGITTPLQVTLIPLFQIYKNLKLLNSYASLILPQVGFALPMAIFLFVAFYKQLPTEMLEAGAIDGASVYKLFLRIVVPMSSNVIITVTTINFIFIWNDYILASTFINRNEMKTLPLGLMDFVGEMGSIDWSATFAAVSLTILPLLIIYFLLNRQVIEGMTSGAVKG